MSASRSSTTPARRPRRLRIAPTRFVVEQRTLPPVRIQAAIFTGSLLGALALGALLLAATGHPPLSTYRTMVETSFGSWLAFSQTLIVTTPLMLTSLAAAVAFRVRLYTIGADGQFVVGAIFASGVALVVGDHAGGGLAAPLALGAGILGGVLWAAIAALGYAYRGASVILSTLMLNFVALNLVTYLVLGSHSFWRDPASIGEPRAKVIPESAQLPRFFEQADVGILVVLVVALSVWLLLRRTRWGYEVAVMGDSPRAAGYAGIAVRHKIVAILCLSGALAGLAGGIQVTNVTQALQPEALNPGLGLGYAGIVVATLGRLSLLATVPLALFVGALLNAGPGLELVGVPSAVVSVLQGAILLLVTGGQFLLSYRVRRRIDRETGSEAA